MLVWRTIRFATWFAGAIAFLPSCAVIAGLGDYRLQPGAGGGGAGGAGAGGSGGSTTVDPCGADAVLVPGFAVCIDRYEASKGSSGKAESVAGEMPWMNIAHDDAQQACAAVGKRLCSVEEWEAACGGLAKNPYPYGATYVQAACNDAHAGIGHVTETGSLPGCEGSVSGLFDMSANAWEWAADCDQNDYCAILGGGYTDVDDLTCFSKSSGEPAKADDGLGFRCCRAASPVP